MEAYSDNVHADEHMGAHVQYTMLIGVSSSSLNLLCNYTRLGSIELSPMSSAAISVSRRRQRLSILRDANVGTVST
jgi:DNA-binding transcriptional regulator YdaS (Cro superfamily)